MKLCENCGSKNGCFQRGIQNPCGNWVTNAASRGFRAAAKKMMGKPMSFKEGQFVEGCTTLEAFSGKQILWLRSLAKRFSISLS